MTPLEQALAAKAEDAERSAIGAVFLRADAFYQADLVAADFWNPERRAIWSAFERLVAGEQPIDVVSVETELERAGVLTAVGGLARLSEYVMAVPTADNVGYYADRIRRAATKRQVAKRVYDALLSETDGEEYQSRVIEAASSVVVRGADDGRSLAEVVDDAFRHVSELADRRARGEPVSWGLPTGFGELDFVMGGLEPGTVTIVAGGTSQGKSSLARQMAVHVARSGAGVDYVTLEDPYRPFGTRALSDESAVALHQVRGGELDRADLQALIAARESLMALGDRFHVEWGRGLTATQICHRVKRHKARLGTKLVVVDYVQLVRDRAKRFTTRKDVVDDAAYELAEVAEKDGVALVLLSQLSRERFKRQDPRPQLSDLKESGDLENLATNVLLVYRDQKMTDNGRAEIIVAKQKDGRVSRIGMGWDGARTRFYDLRPSDRMAGGEA